MDPGGSVHGRVARKREHAGVVLAAEEHRATAGLEPAVDDRQARHVPRRRIRADLIGRPELDPADDAVPVRLRIVRVQVRTPDHRLRHAAAVIDTEQEGMDPRMQLAQLVHLRGRDVVAGIHQMAVQVQFRGLGALQVQRHVLLPPHIRRHDLLPVPGLARIGEPARQPPRLHGPAILRLRRREPLPRQIRRPRQVDAVGEQRIRPLPQERIDRHPPLRIQTQSPRPGHLQLRGACDRHNDAYESQPAFHTAKVRIFLLFL